MTCIGSHFSIGGRERKENPEPGRQTGGREETGQVLFRMPSRTMEMRLKNCGRLS